MNERHAILAGPVKDPNQARTVKHGALYVEGCSIRLRLNDGRHVRVTLDDSDAMRALARDLIRAADDRDLTERLRKCDD
jgi:hypothetical protein